MTPDKTDRQWTLPGWLSHFQYFSSIPGTLRILDLLGHIRLLGLPELVPPVAVSENVSVMATPVLHRGERVSSIFLAEKDGGQEFTQEDGETLALFASQAAMAIANARRHLEEQRARADLETLVDTSPVGVVVFDAVTGAPKSFNRETMRIAAVQPSSILSRMRARVIAWAELLRDRIILRSCPFSCDESCAQNDRGRSE